MYRFRAVAESVRVPRQWQGWQQIVLRRATKPLRPLFVIVGGPLAAAALLTVLMRILLPGMDTFGPVVLMAAIGLAVTFPLFLVIGWAIYPRKLPGDLSAAKKRYRNVHWYTSLAMAFSVGCAVASRLNQAQDAVFILCVCVVFLGAVVKMFLATRWGHLQALKESSGEQEEP